MTYKGNKEKSVNLIDNVGTSAFSVTRSTGLSSSVASSSQSFEFQPAVEQVSDVDEVQPEDELEEVDWMEQMDEVDEVGQVDEEEEVEQMEQIEKLEQEGQLDQVEEDKQLDRVEQEDQADQAEQEASSPSSVAAGISDEVPLGVLLHIFVWTTNPAKP